MFRLKIHDIAFNILCNYDVNSSPHILTVTSKVPTRIYFLSLLDKKLSFLVKNLCSCF